MESIHIDDAEYKQLYQECFTRFLSRDRPSRDPIEFGCRISAFLYVLFCFLWNKDRKVRDPLWKGERLDRTPFFQRIDSIINLEEISIHNELLNTIFVDNQVAGHYAVLSAESPSHVDRIEDYTDGMIIPVKMSDFNILFSKFPFAIFGIAFKEYMPGVIIHYFVIRKEGDGYVMISSYGSNYADIEQYETPLDIEEFTEYVRQLSIRERDIQVVKAFMKKYFLDKKCSIQIKTTGLDAEGHPIFEKKPTCHYSEDGTCYEKTTDATIDAELSAFYGNITGNYPLFDVVCFNQVLDTLSTLTNLTGGMRKRKTRKGKRTHYVRSRRMYRRTLHKK